MDEVTCVEAHEPHSDAHARGDTRERIQAVALELFAEQGYEKTSLREIAETLGVTKAALYYHFKSKEDIVSSLVEDYFGQIDALIEWARSQPRTAEVRGTVLSRYFGIVDEGSQVFRMLQQNQAALSTLASAKHRSELFKERMDGLVGILTEPDTPLPGQIRAAVALASVSFGCMFFAERASGPAELREAVLDIAFGLADARAPAEAPPAPMRTPAASGHQTPAPLFRDRGGSVAHGDH
jgi:AcrR family transcriptional regulator